VYPGFLSIRGSGSQIQQQENKKEGEKQMSYLFCSQIFHKIEIYSCTGTENKVEPLTKKDSIIYPKIVTKLSEI
jgi:hypothetical protein